MEEEDAVTMMLEAGDGDWTNVMNGIGFIYKHSLHKQAWPPVASAPSFEHDTTFQVFEDCDSGSEDLPSLTSASDNCDNDDHDDVGDASLSDYLASGAIWMDEADEDIIRISDPLSPCCMFACTSRGRQCLMDLMWTVRDSWPENPAWLEPPPGIVTQEETHLGLPPALECETPVQLRHAAKKARRRKMTSHWCNPLPWCQHDHHNAPMMPPMSAGEGELLGNPDDEVMDWDASASMSALLTSKPGLRWLLLAV